MYCNECVVLAKSWNWEDPVLKVEPSDDTFIFSVEVGRVVVVVVGVPAGSSSGLVQ